MFGAVFGGVADKDLGPRPRSLSAQGRGVRGRLGAFFVQVGVDILCREIRDENELVEKGSEVSVNSNTFITTI